MRHNPLYPRKHVSVRVPWHDKQWNGSVCDNAKANSACLILKTCALARDDEKESREGIRGASIRDFTEENFPACITERGTFMADFSLNKTVTHPYIKTSPSTHGHLQKTNLRFPAFSAAAVPYYWMRKENATDFASKYDLNYDKRREPALDWQKNIKINDEKGWIQEYHNQKALLNCFFEHLEEEESLVFFYAKQVPFVETSGRVVIGVGKVKKIIPSEKYNGSNSRFSAAYWEHMLIHSIRSNMDDGFLLPYHAAIEHQKEHPDFDPASLAVIVPHDKKLEFSYAAEHVGNDSAIRVLLDCVESWNRAKEAGIGEHHNKAITWIHTQLQRIQKMRGSYPGMGAALCAFGIEKGHFVAAEIINNMQDKGENPWKIFERALDDPRGILSDKVARLIPANAGRLYQKFSTEAPSARVELLHLISRFDITIEQAKRIYIQEERQLLAPDLTDGQILENPYLIYELNLHQKNPIVLQTIDLGLFPANRPDDLLPVGVQIDDPLNSYRIRALTFQQLHIAASVGHTLLPRNELVKQIRSLTLEPKCDLNSDYYDLAEEVFGGIIEKTRMKNGDPAYQLNSLAVCREVIKRKVVDRINGQPLLVADKWEDLLPPILKQGGQAQPDEREEKAKEEKLASLRQIASSRFSVLIGPAGTGKTTLLTVLASHPDIKKNGILLLAPTGKARVRMETIARGLDITARTLAQFLMEHGRYNGELQRYCFSPKNESSYETVILDEASMLTEEMLATTLDCLKHAKRFILVGDHRQLPPIGAGRPFVDIIHYLKPEGIETLFPRTGKGYAELTIKMRQGGSRREDIQLAEWFSGGPLETGADQIINDILANKKSDFLRLVNWENESDFEKKLEEVLVEELELGSIDNVQQFNITLGSLDGKYFNNSRSALYFQSDPAVEHIEDWQILSPVREKSFGVRNINRMIHQRFRKGTVNYAINGRIVKARTYEFVEKKIPKPAGIEQIVYGDKVINLANHSRNNVYPPDKALAYLANGEIGIVTGQFKQKNATYTGQPQNVEIEFSSQKGFVYSFTARDFREEGDPPLELAYALTVHKSQGSEFGIVFLVIPNPCLLLTREMLYTALTRQKHKVIVLFQGNGFDIKKLSSPLHSDTLKRITNLFTEPELAEVEGNYLEKNLIHQASDGEMLRSKSELLIYQRLLEKGLQPIYEKKLIIEGVEKLPDFTIENPEQGITYYWEHCGIMHDSEYRERWKRKYEWYIDNEIKPPAMGGGKNGILIITEDRPTILHDGSARGAISVKEIDDIINRVFNRS